MKPNINDWTIVIVGNWNVAILNPDWVAEKVFEEEEITVEVMFGAGQTGLKLGCGPVQLTPTPGRVIISAASTNDVDKAERAAVRLLGNLPVTPVTSVGVNFGFVESDPSPELLSLFDLNDKSLISNEGWVIGETSIIRRLRLDDQTLNLRVTHGESDVFFHANFHWDVRSTAAVQAIIDGNALKLRDQAREILKKIYNVEEETAL